MWGGKGIWKQSNKKKKLKISKKISLVQSVEKSCRWETMCSIVSYTIRKRLTRIVTQIIQKSFLRLERCVEEGSFVSRETWHKKIKTRRICLFSFLFFSSSISNTFLYFHLKVRNMQSKNSWNGKKKKCLVYLRTSKIKYFLCVCGVYMIRWKIRVWVGVVEARNKDPALERWTHCANRSLAIVLGYRGWKYSWTFLFKSCIYVAGR